MSDSENIVSDGEFFGNTFDKPKEGVEQNRKRECLNGAISKRNPVGGNKKWTLERADKTTMPSIKHMLNTSTVN